MRGQARWIRSPRADIALALAWAPFALVAVAVRGDGHELALFLEALGAFSFLHQPLTLPLVYGDRAQFARRRTVFIAGPLVLALVIALGLAISFTLVAVVGGLWNMEHTLMQRYGFARIYGRKSGEEDGRLERSLLLAWLAGVLLAIAADPRTPDRIASLPLGKLHRGALDALISFRPYTAAMLVPTVVTVVVLTARWARLEWTRTQRGVGNPAKQLYLASTAVMFAVAVLVDPLVGLAGYAGAHAVEYFFIVDHRLAATKSTAARRRFFAGYLLAFLALYRVARIGDGSVYLVVVLYFGGLHFLLDSFIWKSRPASAMRSAAPAVRPALQPIASKVSA